MLMSDRRSRPMLKCDDCDDSEQILPTLEPKNVTSRRSYFRSRVVRTNAEIGPRFFLGPVEAAFHRPMRRALFCPGLVPGSGRSGARNWLIQHWFRERGQHMLVCATGHGPQHSQGEAMPEIVPLPLPARRCLFARLA